MISETSKYNNQLTHPNVDKAVAFFTQAGLSRLLAKLRQKYIVLGQVRGQVLLDDSTPGERREIASFLGKPPYRDANFKVRLIDVEKAIQHSFGCTLPDVLGAFFPDQPLVTRQEQRAAHAIHQADFRSALLSLIEELPEGSRGRFWLLHGQHGQEWLFSRYKNAPPQEQAQQLTLLRYIVNVLDQLPGSDSPERLALFSQRTSGDPHTLDPDKTAGRLFLLALKDLAGEHSQSPSTSVGAREAESGGVGLYGRPPGNGVARSPGNDLAAQEQNIEAQQASAGALFDKTLPTSPQHRAHELQLYTNVGLLVDTISSSVAVFNLARRDVSQRLP